MNWHSVIGTIALLNSCTIKKCRISICSCQQWILCALVSSQNGCYRLRNIYTWREWAEQESQWSCRLFLHRFKIRGMLIISVWYSQHRLLRMSRSLQLKENLKKLRRLYWEPSQIERLLFSLMISTCHQLKNTVHNHLLNSYVSLSTKVVYTIAKNVSGKISKTHYSAFAQLLQVVVAVLWLLDSRVISIYYGFHKPLEKFYLKSLNHFSQVSSTLASQTQSKTCLKQS